MDRFASTTEHLRDTAAALLVEVGPRSFTQEALATRGYVAIGTVYQRWSSRVETLADLAESRLLPQLASFPGTSTDLFDSPQGRALLRLASDFMLAARDHAELVPFAIRAAGQVGNIATPTDSASEHLRWWFTSCAIGWGMLLAGDDGLPPVTDVIGHIGTSRSSNPRCRPIGSTNKIEPIIPPTPPAEPTDSTGRKLKAAARGLLASRTRQAFNTREIAGETGVSTGSMYRRFPSMSELLRALLVDEVQESRYEWTADMVAALTGHDPVPEGAQVITQAMSKVFEDHEAQRLILELTVAARTETTLRTQIVGQIAAAVDARRNLFVRLQDLGVIVPNLDVTQLSWIFQAPPIGARLVGALGEKPSDDQIRSGITSILDSFLTHGGSPEGRGVPPSQ